MGKLVVLVPVASCQPLLPDHAKTRKGLVGWKGWRGGRWGGVRLVSPLDSCPCVHVFILRANISSNIPPFELGLIEVGKGGG